MNAVLKIDPKNLPAPPIPPTKPFRYVEKVSIAFEARDYASDFKADAEKMKERRRRARESRERTMNNAYTAEQEALMMALYKQGISYEAISKKVGRTKGAVKQKIASLRKIHNFNRQAPLQRTYTRHKPESEIVRRNHYTPAQDSVIREMRAQGKTFREIGEQIGKSKEAVRKRYNMIGG